LESPPIFLPSISSAVPINSSIKLPDYANEFIDMELGKTGYSPTRERDVYYRYLKEKFDDGRNDRNNCSLHATDDVCVIKFSNKQFRCAFNDVNMRNLSLEFHDCKYKCEEWVTRQENHYYANQDYSGTASPWTSIWLTL
jgi:hypothetical protein